MIGRGRQSLADLVLANETEGFSLSGIDITARVKHLTSPGLNFSGDANNLLTYTTPSIKRIRQKFQSLDPSFDSIENYAGFGYRWRHEQTSA